MCEQLQAGAKFLTNMASRDVKRIKEYIQKFNLVYSTELMMLIGLFRQVSKADVSSVSPSVIALTKG